MTITWIHWKLKMAMTLTNWWHSFRFLETKTAYQIASLFWIYEFIFAVIIEFIIYCAPPPHRKNIHREISEFICIDYILCMSNVGFVSIQLTLFLHVWMYSTFEIVISKKQRCKENGIKSWSPLFTNVIFVYCCPIMIYVNITSEYFIIQREIRLHNR